MFNLNSQLHFVGIGGIGMSGLAQMLTAMGHKVSGSDRALGQPENQRIFKALRKQGIELFPQDGSYSRSLKPDFLIYSTAIEDDNPDFKAAPENSNSIHRSEALSFAIKACVDKTSIAVSGSCGKTTVSAWLAETMTLMGLDPMALSGGLINRFTGEDLAGNFRPGNGDCFVFEADESDKSLLNYHPDYALLLNVGTDHYERDELGEMFQQFLSKVKIGAVVEAETVAELKLDQLNDLPIKTFSINQRFPADWTLTDYKVIKGIAEIEVNSSFRLTLPMPGIHNAANALAIFAILDLMKLDLKSAIEMIPKFNGVWRRFETAGRLPVGARVVDDYAHNVEKIVSGIKSAREVCEGKIITIFQPHGFAPLRFMREALYDALSETLRTKDIFAFLPVFYAGGTAVFHPTANEVAGEYRNKGGDHFVAFESRAEACEFLKYNAESDDLVLIMGARDNSLSDWSRELTEN